MPSSRPTNAQMTNSRIGGMLWRLGAQAPSVVGGKTFTPAAWYPSSSDPKKGYTVCEVNDGTVSCDCMGWTRRNPPGGRTCKHTEDYIAFLRPLWNQGGTMTSKAMGDAIEGVLFPETAGQKEKGGTLADLFAKMEKGGL